MEVHLGSFGIYTVHTAFIMQMAFRGGCSGSKLISETWSQELEQKSWRNCASWLAPWLAQLIVFLYNWGTHAQQWHFTVDWALSRQWLIKEIKIPHRSVWWRQSSTEVSFSQVTQVDKNWPVLACLFQRSTCPLPSAVFTDQANTLEHAP